MSGGDGSMGIKRAGQPGYVKSVDSLGRTAWVRDSSVKKAMVPDVQVDFPEFSVDTFEGCVTIDGEEYVMVNPQGYDKSENFSKRFLVDSQGAPCAWAIFHHETFQEPHTVVGDIQVRDSHKGRGLAKKWLYSMEDMGAPYMSFTGSFTEDGFHTFKDFPVAPGYEGREINTKPMDYIHDWDGMQTQHWVS